MKERFLIFREGDPAVSPRREVCSPTVPPSGLEQPSVAPTTPAERTRQAAGVSEKLCAKDPYTDIERVTPETLEKARTKLKEALAWIKTKLAGKTLPIKLNINYSDVEKYLPLMIKESRLIENAVSPSGAAGYFQLKPKAIEDVNRIFYPERGTKIFDTAVTMEGVTQNSLNNCIAGILFYHMCVDHYAGTPPFDKLTASERKIIGHMIFNKGFRGIKKLWELSGQKNYAAFEKKLADELAVQLGASVGPQVVVRDQANYMNVDYKEYPAIKKYLELYSQNSSLLKQPFKVNGTETGLTLAQAGEVLRYGRIIEGVENHGKLKLTQPCAAPETEPDDNGTSDNYEIDEIQKDHGLWSMADKLMQECQADGMEGFEDLQTHIERQSMREILIEAIIDFNMANNPEFKNVPDDVTKYVFKAGTKIFIPNKKYIEFVIKGLGEKAKEDAAKVKKDYEKPETKEALKTIPVYTDPLEEAKAKTQTPLKNKKYPPLDNPEGAPTALEEKDIPIYVNAKGESELATSRWHLTDRHGRKLKEPRKETPELRTETKYIILHSTISSNGDDAKKSKKAHYVVEKDGSITYVLNHRYYLNHAGRTEDTTAQARWNGDDEISKKSIGIEVVAQKGEEWNAEQYDAIKRLVHLMGSIYKIDAKNVLTHSQVAMATYTGGRCRGRKSDPININWALLDLPDNSKLVDQDVALGLVSPNFGEIAEQSKTEEGDWYGYREDKLVGLRAAAAIAEKSGRAFWRKTSAPKPTEARERHPFKIYKVRKGDTLSRIADKQKTTVAQIKKDNPSIKGDTIFPGMMLKIRK